MKMKKNLIDYELLWEKITDYAKATGRTTARPVLLLYYVLRSPETPSSDKMLIVAALSYLVLPIDLISAKTKRSQGPPPEHRRHECHRCTRVSCVA